MDLVPQGSPVDRVAGQRCGGGRFQTIPLVHALVSCASGVPGSTVASRAQSDPPSEAKTCARILSVQTAGGEDEDDTVGGGVVSQILALVVKILASTPIQKEEKKVAATKKRWRAEMAVRICSCFLEEKNN